MQIIIDIIEIYFDEHLEMLYVLKFARPLDQLQLCTLDKFQ